MTSPSASSSGTVTPPPPTLVHVTSNVAPNPLNPSGVVSQGQGSSGVKQEFVGQISGVSGSGLKLLDSTPIGTPLQTDEELFQKVALGRRECLGELVERYEQPLFSLLLHLTGGDRSRADDLFQETFLRAVQAAASFDPSKRFKAWINTIAVNLVRDDARRRKRRGEVHHDDDPERGPSVLPSHAEGPAASAARNDEAAMLKRTLKELTEKEREVVLLHFYDGMTLLETSEALEIPLGTVKSRLHGALTRLKGLLEQDPS